MQSMQVRVHVPQRIKGSRWTNDDVKMRAFGFIFDSNLPKQQFPTYNPFRKAPTL